MASADKTIKTFLELNESQKIDELKDRAEARRNGEKHYLDNLLFSEGISYFDVSNAIKYGDLDINGRFEDKYIGTPLLGAVMNNDFNVVDHLIKHKADVNMDLDSIDYPHVFNGARFDMLKFLVDRGGDPKLANLNKYDQLFLGSMAMNEIIDGDVTIDDVIALGFDPHAVNSKGRNVMHSIIVGTTPTDPGFYPDYIDNNLQDNEGNTPMHYVAEEDEDVHTIKYFISKDIDPTIKNNEGITAADIFLKNLKDENRENLYGLVGLEDIERYLDRWIKR